MKFILYLGIIFFFCSALYASNDFALATLNMEFERAGVDKKKGTAFYNKLKSYVGNDAKIIAYKAAATAYEARSAFMPTSKLSYARLSMKTFITAITLAPDDAEIRYLRFAIQTNLPSILNLSKNINEDKHVILKNIHKLNNNLLEQKIIRLLINSGKCNAQEIEQLKNK